MNVKKYAGLFQCMESIEFVKDLRLMHVVLEEMEILSLQLQERFCTITRADKLIKTTIRVVWTMKKKKQDKKKEKLPKHQWAWIIMELP
jgi:hypothetical protein